MIDLFQSRFQPIQIISIFALWNHRVAEENLGKINLWYCSHAFRIFVKLKANNLCFIILIHLIETSFLIQQIKKWEARITGLSVSTFALKGTDRGNKYFTSSSRTSDCKSSMNLMKKKNSKILKHPFTVWFKKVVHKFQIRKIG